MEPKPDQLLVGVSWKKYRRGVDIIAEAIVTLDVTSNCVLVLYGIPRGGTLLCWMLLYAIQRALDRYPELTDVSIIVCPTLIDFCGKIGEYLVAKKAMPNLCIEHLFYIVDDIIDSGGTLKCCIEEADKVNVHHHQHYQTIAMFQRYTPPVEVDIVSYYIQHSDWLVFPYE